MYIFLLVLLVFPPQYSLSSDENILSSLKGCFCEGGFFIGKASKKDKIIIDEKIIRVSDDGFFVFAFGRDFKDHIIIAVNKSKKKIKIKQKKYKIERINNLPNNKVEPKKKDLDKIFLDQKKIKKAKNSLIDRKLFVKSFTLPVKGRISGVFGSQRILNNKPKRPHYGLDIAANLGTPIHSPSDGKVILTEESMFFTGKTVIIDHGLGIKSIFAHLDRINVKEGEIIEGGTKIGTVGKTGRATGPHLHWGIYLMKTPIDPESLIGRDLNI